MVAVTGHYISFTFIAVIIRDVVGVRGPDIAWLLAIYGDRRPAGDAAGGPAAGPSTHAPPRSAAWSACDVTLLVLTALAFHRLPAVATALIGIVAIALWGATANAVSPMLQAAAMRAGADDPDGASGPVHGGLPGRHHGRVVRRRPVLRARCAGDVGRIGGPDRRRRGRDDRRAAAVRRPQPTRPACSAGKTAGQSAWSWASLDGSAATR